MRFFSFLSRKLKKWITFVVSKKIRAILEVELFHLEELVVKQRLYFAHPINIYSTPLEAALLVLLGHYFPEWEIENPNQPHHEEGYQRYAERQRESETKHKGMGYFYENVLPSCAGCAAFPFLDGRIGLGVASEVEKGFLAQGKEAHLIDSDLTPSPEDLAAFIENPQASDLFRIRFFTGQEMKRILAYDTRLVVPHEETRLRTWEVYNRVRRPFEKAHLLMPSVPDGFYPQETKK